MTMIDLRSDTVTRPTAQMRRAMADADVGDDAYQEDPTVRALEEAFAARVGMEAALLVPSGIMGNQIALRVLARPGDIVLAGRRQHVVLYEEGAASRNAGVQLMPLDDGDGMLAIDDIRQAMEAADHHNPRPAMVCVENTHMPAGGAIWPVDALAAIGALGLPVHLDGARLFHAEVASGLPAASWCASAATVMCCLSKGLCAPVGSMLAGAAPAMAEARTARRQLGGQMRQAGVLAAAGLVALDTMIPRLADDHARAQRLADAVADRWPDAGCAPDRLPTNIVVFRHGDPAALMAHLAGDGILAGTIAPGVVRFVTHHDVDDAGVERALKSVSTAP
jgi:threonine aldolase